MREAIFMLYGYFLRGTGSAIYARDLCRALNEAGVDVVLFSQEERPEEFDFVARAFAVEGGTLRPLIERTPSARAATVHVRPDLAGFLPVYVYDTYPGYADVREFADLPLTEVKAYAERVAGAVRLAMSHLPYVPRGFVVHHLFPLPLAASLAGVRRRAIVYHGSDLNFALRRRADLNEAFLEDLTGDDVLVALAESGVRAVSEHLAAHGRTARIVAIPPGIEAKYFALRPRKRALAELDALLVADADDEEASRLACERSAWVSRLVERSRRGETLESLAEVGADIERVEARKLTEPSLRDALATWKEEPLVVFAGKYLATKGIQSLLLAVPLVLESHPEARFLVVGFGGDRWLLELLRAALSDADLDRSLEVAAALERSPTGSDAPPVVPAARVFLSNLRQGGGRAAHYARLLERHRLDERVAFAGYLDHRRLGLLLAAADVFVAPSQFPESFGLVAIEAAACGAVPVVAYESSFADTLDTLANDVAALRDLPRVRWGDTFVPRLSEAIARALALPTRDAGFRRKLSEAVERRFSWDAAARRMLSLVPRP